MRTGLCLMLLMVAACAGQQPSGEENTSADRQYREADAEIRALEEFERLRASCARSGRVVAVRRYSGSRLIPALKDADTAVCW